MRLFGPVSPFSAFAIALSGQVAFMVLYSLWQLRLVRRIQRAINDPNTDVRISYTQRPSTTRAKSTARRIIARLWSVPGLLAIACAVAGIFLGLQELLS